MANYLIETYAPRRDDRAMLMRSTASQIAAGAVSVTVRWAAFAPEDELCIWVLSAPSRDALDRELARVGIEGHIQLAELL